MRRLALLVLAAAAAGCGAVPQRPAPARESPAAVRYESYRSQALNGVEHYAVYLPPGYGSSPNRRYPVIYALHGLPSDANGYRRMGIASWGADAVRAGRPAIVVAPQGARAGDTDPEWHDWGPGRDWETAVADELVHQVDGRFRTIADRRGRALIGASAGGYGATIIGIHHPGEFSVIESWSGYFHPTNPVGDAPLDVGSPDADEAASVHSYVSGARRMFARYKPLFFGFFVGDEDPHFVPENEQLHRELLAAKVPHAYAVYPGAHTGAFWAAHEQEWIAMAVQQLAQSG
ncbi:MAG TPA: alpha/beta hydrolase-fold protein [Solirubrobacteraceae bacterium]|jgi:enterochelin esterase-like enzyme